YDKSSNVISTSNSRLLNEGRRINFIYDSLNRLTEKNYEDKNGAPVVTRFTYGKPDSGNSSGRLVKTEDETGTVEVEYGSLGEIKKEVRVMKQNHDVNGKDMEAVMEYTGNYLGQMEKMKYPDGEEIKYIYDDAGQICAVKGSNGDYVDDIGYDECGQRVYIKYANGVSTTYDYKKETRLLDVIKTKKDSKFYQNIKYDFTKAGNIKQYTNDCLSGSSGNYRTTQSYEYDGLYQLTKASGTTELNRHGFTHPEVLSKYEQNFTFDRLGNMKTKKSSEVTVTGSKKGDDLNYEFDYEIEEGHAHRYSRIGKRYYKYDEAGNIICEQDVPFSEDDTTYTKVEKLKDKVWGMDEGWGYFSDAPGSGNSSAISKKKINRRTYEWNAENQLTGTTDESLTVNYTYGADGKRASKYTHSSETLYFNDYWVWHIDSATRSRGGKVTKNIYLGTERVASRIGSYNTYDGEERENTFFYHPDHLGSAQLVTDHSGNEYQRLEYTPYGETWMDLKAETSLILKLPYKFSAKELDEETGLYYYGARYLDPRMSRWITADPAMNTGEYFSNPDAGMGGIYNHVNFNLYHYAGNNPINYTDPDGRKSKAPPKIYKWMGFPYTEYENTLKKRGMCLPNSFAEFGKVADTTNCYAYAFNLTENPSTHEKFKSSGLDWGLQPGLLSDRWEELLAMKTIDKYIEKLVKLIEADAKAIKYTFRKLENIDDTVTPGNWKIAIVAAELYDEDGNVVFDYHFYRLTDTGFWYHKPGHDLVTNKDYSGKPIRNPEAADRRFKQDGSYEYKYFIGYYEVGEKK
uniref:RHS repeat domain-containing protein n=1 Tax=Treponema sp. TaxID=166 RepID=UPI00388D603C